MIAASTARRRWRVADDPLRAIVIAGLWLLLGVFVVYPLACLVVRAFSDDGAFTLAPFVSTLRNANHLRALRNSLLLAFLVAVVGTVAGFLFAFTAERARISRSAKRLLDAVALLPLISPPFTSSIAFVFSFGPRGLITHDLLGLQNTQVYGWTSTLAAEALTYFPLAYLALRPLIASIGGDLEEAAYSLGGSRWRVFRTVTLPLTVPGLGNAFLLLFAASLADFATPLILSGNDLPVLPTEAYLQITGMFDLKSGAVLSLLLLAPAALVFLAQRHFVARRSYVTVTGKVGGQGRPDSVAPWTRVFLICICVAVMAFIVYLYALLVYASAVVAFGANGTLTLNHYRVIFTEGLPAIRDTLIIALIGMPLGGLYGVVVGYLVSRTRFAGRQAMEIVSMINYALPGTIVGIAYLIAFNDKPFVLTGTAAIIIVCYVFRYSPTGIRTTVALLQQIDRSIEEASFSLGAGSFATFRRIMLPLILPAFFAGLGVVFIRAMTAISATIFLVSINWTLITVRILENMTELSLGPAAAFSVFVIVVVLVVTSALNLALRQMTTPEMRPSTVGG
ncbi:MAG: iron ABC transporter permease [Proteobacteria bacterium]|nr:iron ABC transporter permease [Pseudomonadota bacterium]MBI3496480.1 iron ABC transporter permease [Pseudomonadota bacterium]